MGDGESVVVVVGQVEVERCCYATAHVVGHCVGCPVDHHTFQTMPGITSWRIIFVE